MKIKQLFAGIFFALMLCSCSQKKEENKILYPNVHAQKATFNLLLNNTISGELKEFLLKPVYKNSSFIYVIEDLYPQCTGIYDLSLFYSESCDDASWVDDLLF